MTTKEDEIIFEVVNSSKKSDSNKFSWGSIKGKVPSYMLPVEQWTNSGFGHYADGLYFNHFKESMSPGRAYSAIAIKRIRKTFSKITGKDCDNQTLKEYIEYFFNVHIKDVVAEHKKFTIGMMAIDTYVNSFVKSQVEKKIDVNNIKEKTNVLSISIDSISKKEKIGLQAVLQNYGIVICVAYLIKEKGLLKGKAVCNVKTIIEKMLKSDKRYWNNIKNSTEKYNPYPLWMWTTIEEIVKEIQNNLKIKLEKVDLINGENPYLEILK